MSLRARERVPLLAAAALALIWAWLLATSSTAGAFTPAVSRVAANTVYQRPIVTPIPVTTTGVTTPVVNLGGTTWKFNPAPPGTFWSNAVDPSGWANENVPGQPSMHGFSIPYDTEMAYKHVITVPSDFSGKRVIIQFDGVYSYARLWVDGNYVRDHEGGMSTWDADITRYVTPGRTAMITVGVTDRSDDPSFGSGYATDFNAYLNRLGGTMRDVRLLAVPNETYLNRFDVDTQLDPTYTDGNMRVYLGGTGFPAGFDLTVTLGLTDDATGSAKTINAPSPIQLTSGSPEIVADVPVNSVKLWDQEHPNLYTLTATVRNTATGTTLGTYRQKVGFREVRVSGNHVLINGQVVHLRGTNHHEITALEGRAATGTIDDSDVRDARAANVNFIRTSHYPPTRQLLDAADKYGMFVYEETAITWANSGPEGDPAYRDRFLGQFAQMIARDRGHPSVIVWSLGNESLWGSNFADEYDYAHQEDPSRLSIFSDGVASASARTDVTSTHYPDPTASWVNRTKPVVFDEFAPNAQWSDPDDLKRDPNIHNSWGTSIDTLTTKAYTSDGVFGGAIWAGWDDVFQTQEGTQGYGQWGFIDIWRRQKPEYWLTFKAFSPVRIADAAVAAPAGRTTVNLPVENRFNSTNLRELRFDWTVHSNSGTATAPNVAAGARGTLTVTAPTIVAGDILRLRIYRRADAGSATQDLLVDQYDLPIGTRKQQIPVDATVPNSPASPSVTNNASTLVVSGTGWDVTFSKTTGLITQGRVGTTTVVNSGPFLHVVGDSVPALEPWTLSSFSFTSGTTVVVTSTGRYGGIGVTYRITVDGAGRISTAYTLNNTLSGNFTEIGVAYHTPSTVSALSWYRNSQWTSYPSDHIGRTTGTASCARGSGTDTYLTAPTWAWSLDEKAFDLFTKDDPGGRCTTDWQSEREKVYYESIKSTANNSRLRAEAPGDVAVRTTAPGLASVRPCARLWCVDDQDARPAYTGSWLHENNVWSGPGWLHTWSISNTTNDFVDFTFEGTSIKWIADTQWNMGKADVFLDGVLVGNDVDLYTGHDRPGSPPEGGNYQKVMYSASGLSAGRHTIRVQVTGTANPSSGGTYVNVDAFAVDGIPTTVGSIPPTNTNEFILDNYVAYPGLSWGNVTDPTTTMPSGYSRSVQMRLTDRDGLPNSVLSLVPNI